MLKALYLKIKRTLTITRKEFIHIRRDKPSLIISFVMPIMMLMIFGFAVNTDVDQVPFAVYDSDRSAVSRQLVETYSNIYYFDKYASVNDVVAIERLIDQSIVKVGVIIPKGFSKDIKRGDVGKIQILVDGSDPAIAKTAGQYSVLVANQFGTQIGSEIAMRTGVRQGEVPIRAATFFMYNPTLESSNFNVPGVVGLILQNITIILTALAMVREKELGTIEQLIMTPITSLELIIGKLIPYVVIGIYDFLIVILLSKMVFKVDIVGSFWLLFLLGFIFLVGALAMGMLISTIAKNQAQAIQGSMAFLLPSVLLSGFMFPRESMPLFIQWFSATFPITHFLIILRGVMLKGVGFNVLRSSTVAMIYLIVLILAITAMKFNKKLDD